MEINSKVLDEAWKYLEDSIVYFQGQPIGTVASRDTETAILNYDQVFTRDFFVSAIAFLLNNRYDIMKNFLTQSVNLQGIEKRDFLEFYKYRDSLGKIKQGVYRLFQILRFGS